MITSVSWTSVNLMVRQPKLSQAMLALALGLSACDTLSTELFGAEAFQIHGFASQAAISTTGNNFFGKTEGKVDFDFRELGINGSWRMLPNVQLSLQAVARWAGETDNGKPRIDYGFIDYSFLSDADNLWGARAGRMMNPLGLYNDTRDVAFTRPSILLPQSIYFDVNRNLAISADGVYLYGERRANIGDFFLQLGAIVPRVEDPDLKNDLTQGTGGSLDGNLSWFGRLLYEVDGGALRLGISGGQISGDIHPDIPILYRKFDFDPLIFSAQYNAERWSLTSEYALRYARLQDSPDPASVPTFKSLGESYYLQGIYRLAPQWQILLRYDVLIWNKDDPDGKTFEKKSGIPAYRRFAKDWTIGTRWDITPNFMLRAEYHNINGTGWISNLENQNGSEQYWNLFAILASYRF